MVYSVALTGDIGSGKSTAAQLFSEHGVQIISADQISKELTQKDTPSYQMIVDHFGEQIVLENKDLNRKKLRDIIFANTHERQWLEKLLHPLIRDKIKKQISDCPTTYCIVEIPLLTTKEHYPYLNRILVITSSEELRIKRVIQRDNCSREQALAILASQPHHSIRLKNADDVINNDSDLNHLKKQVNELHEFYLQNSQSKTHYSS